MPQHATLPASRESYDCVRPLAGISYSQDVIIYFNDDYTFESRIWRFDLDTEQSIGTWYSSMLLLLCALSIFYVLIRKLRTGGRNVLRWFLLSVIFLILSMDETVSFHEWLSGQLSAAFRFSGIFFFAWVVPAIVLVPLGFVKYLPLILEFSSWQRMLLVSSAVVYLSGALGLEMAAGSYVSQFGVEGLYYRSLANLEELLEMLGLVLFLSALLRFARDTYGAFHLELG